MTAATAAGTRAASATAGQLIFTGSVTPHDEQGRLVGGLADVADAAAQATTGQMLIDAPTERAVAQSWRVLERLAGLLAEHGATLADVLRLRVFLRDRRDLTAFERALGRLIPQPWPTTAAIEMRAGGLDPGLDVQIDAIALAPGPLRKEAIAEPAPGRAGYAAATVAGQLLFASNLVGIDPATGALAQTVDQIGPGHEQVDRFAFVVDREQRILAQSWFIFERLRTLVESRGGDLARILKMNGWLSFAMRDYGPLINAREHHFDRATLPVSTGLSIGGVVPDGAELTYDAIALVAGDQGYAKQQLTPSTIGPFYTDAVSAGPFVLTCGEVPIDVSGPRVIESLAALDDPAGRALADGTIHRDGGVEARSWYVYGRLREHLDRFGATLGDVVQQTVYLARVEEYRAFERVALELFGGRVPPTTVVPIVDTSPFPAAELEIDAIAYRNDRPEGR